MGEKRGDEKKYVKEWDSKLKNPTKKFDRCGLEMSKKMLIKSAKNTDKEEETDDKVIVFPSLAYKNIYAFLDDPNLKPLFFKDYKFVISDDPTKTENLEGMCFASAKILLTATLATTLTTLAFI